ncbi:Methyltransferase FkbM [Trinorchestia longiramus]|nr:Methyltransferase FkbM [Trinorchestia longiramus]
MFIQPFLPLHIARLLRSLKGPIPYDDPELMLYIKNEMLVPPSTKPYNLLGKANPALVNPETSEAFYQNITRHLFGKLNGGCFIEAGALDGETMSNTLQLELRQGWSGVLIEADPVSYQHLFSKNRRAWTVNGCLSPHPYPSQEMMSSHSHYTGPSVMAAGFKMRAMHGLLSYMRGAVRLVCTSCYVLCVRRVTSCGYVVLRLVGTSCYVLWALTNSWFKKVQCIPLTSILSALNVTHVDLFVLDVEGAEMDILQGFDFEKFRIDVLFMEWKIRSDHEKVAKEVESFGFRLLRSKGEDLVFARKGTVYDPGVSYVIPKLLSNLTEEQKKTMKMFADKGIILQF